MPLSVAAMAIVMLVAGSVIGIAAYHHFLIVTPDGAQKYQDHFEILPKEDHNVHAIEAMERSRSPSSAC